MASKYNTQKLIKDLKSSGLTHKVFCAQRGIPVSTLAYNLKKHRTSLKAGTEDQCSHSFLPIDIKASGSRFRTLIILKGDFSCDDLIKIASSDL